MEFRKPLNPDRSKWNIALSYKQKKKKIKGYRLPRGQGFYILEHILTASIFSGHETNQTYIGSTVKKE